MKFIISIIIPLAAGFIGSYFTMDAIPTWYQTLNKPSWQPPNWLFAPVWTTLYILMGISLALVWQAPKPKRLAVSLFFVQLILNTLWSIIFFGLKNIDLALIEIVILLFMIILNILAFARISKLAAVLLIPYLGWVTFATFLTFTISRLN